MYDIVGSKSHFGAFSEVAQRSIDGNSIASSLLSSLLVVGICGLDLASNLASKERIEGGVFCAGIVAEKYSLFCFSE